MNLNDNIEKVFRLNSKQKTALKKMGITSVKDLLYHFPSRYGDKAKLKNIKDLAQGDDVFIYAQIKNLKSDKTFAQKIPVTEATLEDGTGKIKAIWFRQPYISKILKEDSFAKFRGTITERKGSLYMANAEFEQVKNIPITATDSLFSEEVTESFIYPVYPESRGVTSKWFYHAMQKILASDILKDIKDPIPDEILKKYNLPSLKTALIWIHSPKKEKDCSAARKRFSFEEIFFIQLFRQKQKKEYQKDPSFKINKKEKEVKKFTERFPFKTTPAQEDSIKQILGDFEKDFAMSRLLEGDVGSGKTAVAAATIYAITTTNPNEKNFGNLQTAYMVPTEILARQHFESFIKYFSYLNINIGLITSSGCKKFPSKISPTEWTDISRTQLLKWVANGEIPILIGTHSLIQKSVTFKDLAYVIIDEQHRFGTIQRQKLTRKDKIVPHLLSMTATPIPRTLALTIYGDLDLTVIDQMPIGRKPIITEIILPNKRDDAYEKIHEEMKKGRQLYIICPRIDEADPDKEMALNVKSVVEEAKRIKKNIFPKYKIDILHSKMKPKEKEEVMEKFASGETNILVATSVVEVGVNVPNATIIIIEGAERFGLAQLHQLRGRVIRSEHQAYCYIFADIKSKKTFERLKALKTAKNGFELAEFDLNLRGPGELSGKKQWGISDLGMEAIKNIKMVEAARLEAQKIIEKDPDLQSYPFIKEKLVQSEKNIHFE